MAEPGPEKREIMLFADYICPYSYAAWVGLERVAPLLKVDVVPRAFELRPPLTRKAHEAVRHAAGTGHAAKLHRAIFDAYFQTGADIGRIDVLVELGREAGLDPMALKVALDLDTFEADVRGDAELAGRLEITGTPAYVAGNEVHVGLLDDTQLLEWLKD